AHRLDAVRRAASRFGCVLLLKGRDTLVTAPPEGVLVSLYGEPSLATAGTGDALTGIIAAFIAKGMEPRLAAARAAPARGVAAQPCEAGLALAIADGEIPEGVPVHLKLDTGMGRWGLSELPAPTREVVGLMTHLATADCDPAFARRQLERFRDATAPFAHL